MRRISGRRISGCQEILENIGDPVIMNDKELIELKNIYQSMLEDE